MLSGPSGLCVRAALLAALASAPAASAGELFFTIDGGLQDLTNSSQSAKAVFDGVSFGPTVGVALQYGLGESFFIRAGGRFFQRNGERVYVEAPGTEVFRMGHPLTLRMIPAYGMLGFRFLEGASVRPYIGVGGGVTIYDEESDVAGQIFTSTATKPSGQAVLGLDFGRGSVRFGGELAYAMVPNTIGFDGVSRVYGEDDVGGFTALVRLSFVR
jgi:hypothetical protein